VSNGDLGWITNFIWGIADDILRDLYVRGKYRDVILPMTVLRRLDAVLEPTKKAVIDMKGSLDAKKIVHQDVALRKTAGQPFYNTSKFTLRDLKGRGSAIEGSEPTRDSRHNRNYLPQKVLPYRGHGHRRAS